jgi:hypothetical protein
MIPEAPTAEALAQEIWQVVSRPVVNRKIAIAAMANVLHTLRLDQESDEDLGVEPTGQPS